MVIHVFYRIQTLSKFRNFKIVSNEKRLERVSFTITLAMAIMRAELAQQ